jgi:hypothetical protein
LVCVDEVKRLLLLLEDLPLITLLAIGNEGGFSPLELLGNAFAVFANGTTGWSAVGEEPTEECWIGETLVEGNSITFVEEWLKNFDGEVIDFTKLLMDRRVLLERVDVEVDDEPPVIHKEIEADASTVRFAGHEDGESAFGWTMDSLAVASEGVSHEPEFVETVVLESGRSRFVLSAKWINFSINWKRMSGIASEMKERPRKPLAHTSL